MTTTPLPLHSVLQQMDVLNSHLQQLEADKLAKVRDALQQQQLLTALDDPQTRLALRAQLELARNQIDALALQLDTQRQAVTAAHARVQNALDKLDKSPKLSHMLASRLSEVTATATQAAKAAGVPIRATPAAAKPSASAEAPAKKKAASPRAKKRKPH